MNGQKTCFVVQGFGEKTDFSDGRKLNLDASYWVIREAVEEAGLKCVRLDEVVTPGAIDRAMYEWIYRADLVIVDLSTYNMNAAYGLGIRFAVRPNRTIVVAEERFRNPFDVEHIVILRYRHLGQDVGVTEGRRFKRALIDRINQVESDSEIDSPVYIFLQLRPPRDAEGIDTASPAASLPAPNEDAAGGDSAKALLSAARDAMAEGKFEVAKAVLAGLRQLLPSDQYVLQLLAVATYKSKLPEPHAALMEARHLLQSLEPQTTTDPETLGIWGVLHRRLWELNGASADLEEAIAAFERAFYLKQDVHSGINYAYLLHVRSTLEDQAGESIEAVADFVLAQRARREVLQLGQAALTAGPSTEDDRFWLLASMWEAAAGSGDPAAAATFRMALEDLTVPQGEMDAARMQISRLESLLAQPPAKLSKTVS